MIRFMKALVAIVRRASMKHVKIGLFCGLLLFFFLLLQMWRTRSDHHNTGQFNGQYRPGAFLKGVKPIRNQFTYCRFNYQIPKRFAWKKNLENYPPEMSKKSPYGVFYDIIENKEYRSVKPQDAVTYVTHATPEFLYHIVDIARFWDGPISVAVFAPDLDFELVFQILTHLCRCYAGMAKVSVHLVFPKRYPPRLLSRRVTPMSNETLTSTSVNKSTTVQTRVDLITSIIKKKANTLKEKVDSIGTLTFDDCSSPDMSTVTTFRKYYGMTYPINVARNVARNASRTEYFLVSDIEMVPSEDLAQKFIEMVDRLKGASSKTTLALKSRIVFVVPLFQVNGEYEVPRNKKILVQMVADNRASYFHQQICSHCQRFPGLHKWLARSPTSKLQPAFVTRREVPYHRWEPLYFGTNREPWYSESLSWEGKQDKMAQMLEMCLMKYRMIILDGGFLCHVASQPTSHEKTKYRLTREKENAALYDTIASRLARKYSHNDRC